MRYDMPRRLKPDIETEWGTWTNPHIVYHPEDYLSRKPQFPQQVRGSRPPMVPRPLGTGTAYAGCSACGMGAAAPASEGSQLLVLLGAIGLVAVIFGGK